MYSLIICFFIGVAVVYSTEYLHTKKLLSTESTRKLIHVTHSLLLISLSFLVSWNEIILAEVMFIVLSVISRKLKLYKSQYDVGRATWGELFFPVGIVIIILLQVPQWVFIVSVLNLGFADAAAALIGKRYGKNNSYTVFGQKKSIAGSLAFFLVSTLLVVITYRLFPESVATINEKRLLIMPLFTMIAENLGAYGSDNLLILVTTSLLLR